MPDHICFNTDSLINKIKHFLITTRGKLETEATEEEFYQALCYALKEEVMINWTATKRSIEKANAKTLHYLSMEYLPGKFLQNNITNLKANELISSVLQKCNRKFADLIKCDPDVGLGNGGLGRLAACFLDSLATQKLPAIGYGLKYQYGIFDQEIWNGVQIERPDCWLLNNYPWEVRLDSHATNVFFKGKMIPSKNSHGDETFGLEGHEDVRAVPYDLPIIGYSDTPDFMTLSLRLWSTKESPRNFELQRYNAGQLGEAGENTSLTDVLYPNDNNETGKRIRLKQEFLLVCSSMQDILRNFEKSHTDINQFPDKVQIQINDTHPALVIAELMRRLVKNHDISWAKAWDITQNSCNYTNHTVLKEALEEWNEQRIEELLPRQYRILQKINQEFCNKIRKRFPGDEEKVKTMSIIESGQIKMAHLAIYGCKKVNGVAELHTDILKNKIFNDFYQMYPDKFVAITNGVTTRRWLLNCNHKLADFITKRIGDEWITDFNKIENLRKFADDKSTQEEFLEIKKENKEKLLNFLSHENPVRDYKGKVISYSSVLDSDALFDVQIKRFHEYKRQLLNALHLIVLVDELEKDPNSRKIKRMIIIGGKAAPGYQVAKEVMLLFFCISRKINENLKISEKLKIVFMENYNVSKAEIIIPASDISEQISTAGLEASGTGNMKLAMNGSLTLGTEDGANIEMRESVTDEWWPFTFGASAEEIEAAKEQKSYKPCDIYIQNQKLKKALDSLKDGSLTKNEHEHSSLCHLFDILLDGDDPSKKDPYFVLNDFDSYYMAQKKIEDFYSDKYKWAKYAINNIAGMGRFSSDIVIHNYADKIWDLKPCEIDPEILQTIREEYTEYDSCNIKK